MDHLPAQPSLPWTVCLHLPGCGHVCACWPNSSLVTICRGCGNDLVCDRPARSNAQHFRHLRRSVLMHACNMTGGPAVQNSIVRTSSMQVMCMLATWLQSSNAYYGVPSGVFFCIDTACGLDLSSVQTAQWSADRPLSSGQSLPGQQYFSMHVAL